MSTKFKLIEKWICDDARARVDRPWQYGAINSETVILGTSQSSDRDAKPQRCRECGKRIAVGETAIEFRHNFTSWTHWWFYAFIHVEACSERVNTMTRPDYDGPSGLEQLRAALEAAGRAGGYE